jgi:AraC-like DNA-binding protein
MSKPIPDPSRAGALKVPAASGSTLGFRALRDELVAQGVHEHELTEGSGIHRAWFTNPDAPIGYPQRLRLIRNAWRLGRLPDTALRAGQRQRVSDFGLFGYAMASSRTLADALRFGLAHIELAGPLLRISMEQRGKLMVFRSQNPQTLGPLLPFVAEFWRSSMTALMSRIIERPFPNRAMYFPYPAPAHMASYHRVFRCALHFGSDRMEWHFDAEVLDAPCPNASQLTAMVCSSFCDRVLAASAGQSALEREVRLILLGHAGRYPSAAEVASSMGMSLRTLFRRLRHEGTTFQALLDGVRRSVAIEFLESTSITVEEIAQRVGVSDASNFRKAFRNWTGSSPTTFRSNSRTVRG